MGTCVRRAKLQALARPNRNCLFGKSFSVNDWPFDVSVYGVAPKGLEMSMRTRAGLTAITEASPRILPRVPK